MAIIECNPRRMTKKPEMIVMQEAAELAAWIKAWQAVVAGTTKVPLTAHRSSQLSTCMMFRSHQHALVRVRSKVYCSCLLEWDNVPHAIQAARLERWIKTTPGV
jgi:hypothetical protein